MFDLSFTLVSHSSFVSPIFHFILLIFHFYLFLFHVDVFGARSPVHFAQGGVWPFGQQRPSLQVMSPTSSMISTAQRPLNFSSRSRPATRGPRTGMTRRSVTAPSAERSPHPLFTQEREDPASRRQAYHSPEESLLPAQSVSVGHVRTVRPVNELSSLVQASEKIQIAIQKMSKSGFFWNDKKNKFSLNVEHRFRNTSSRPIMIEVSIN